MSGNLPDSAAERNEYPLADGLLYYFPAALAAIARVSKIGNDQHNPGEPMHWARGKSTDHANKILRHQLDAGTLDSDGTRHSAKVAWRALAQLQEELEREEGAPLPRNARLPSEDERVPKWDPRWAAEQSSDDVLSYLFDYGSAFVRHELKDGNLVVTHVPLKDVYVAQPPNCDGLSARDVRAPHPMASETLRAADEFDRDDKASGV